MAFSALVIEPINADVVLDKVGTDEDGAGLLFVGVVRDHNEGRSVKGVHYYAYEKMADLVLREIVEEATNSFRLYNSSLSKALKRGIIKKQNVSRKLSSLSDKLKKIS